MTAYRRSTPRVLAAGIAGAVDTPWGLAIGETAPPAAGEDLRAATAPTWGRS